MLGKHPSVFSAIQIFDEMETLLSVMYRYSEDTHELYQTFNAGQPRAAG